MKGKNTVEIDKLNFKFGTEASELLDSRDGSNSFVTPIDFCYTIRPLLTFLQKKILHQRFYETEKWIIVIT